MAPTLRNRLALALLFGVLLIPVATSTLRGLTHILTCEDPVATPFALIIEPNQEPTVISSQTIERDAAETPEQATEEAGGRLCGGLSVDLSARTLGPGTIVMNVPITNHTELQWQGSVLFRLGSTSIPVGIGRIEPGATGSDEVQFNLGSGQHELSGSLLIGP